MKNGLFVAKGKIYIILFHISLFVFLLQLIGMRALSQSNPIIAAPAPLPQPTGSVAVDHDLDNEVKHERTIVFCS